MLKISFEFTRDINKKMLVDKYQSSVNKIHQDLMAKVQSKNPSEMVGWYNFPVEFNGFDAIKKVAKAWRELKMTDVVIIGIGGSYSGVKALVDMVQPDEQKRNMKFHFINSISPTLMENTVRAVENKNFGVICISKSGTTLETSVGFRIFRELLNKQYKKEASHRVCILTDEKHNIMHTMAEKHGYAIFKMPIDIGGRFSSITPITLFPAALLGIDIDAVIEGAKLAHKDFANADLNTNNAYLYAAFRYHMYQALNKNIEVFIVYENFLQGLCIQQQQIFAESEGKDNKALLPVVGMFTTDLHSLGQYFQEGKKTFFETTLLIDHVPYDINIPESSFKDDGLDHLTGKSLNELNKIASESVLTAHSHNGGTPNLLLQLKDASAKSFGYFYFFLSVATAMSATLLGVNPFNQPGVETYKAIMRGKINK